MNNTTLFSVCYNIKHSPCIQRGTLVLVDSHSLSLIMIWPEQQEESQWQQQQRVSSRNWLGLSSWYITLNHQSSWLLDTCKYHLKINKTYFSTSHWDRAGPTSSYLPNFVLAKKSIWAGGISKDHWTILVSSTENYYCSVSFGFQCGDFRQQTVHLILKLNSGVTLCCCLRNTAESRESSICLQWRGNPHEIVAHSGTVWFVMPYT